MQGTNIDKISKHNIKSVIITLHITLYMSIRKTSTKKKPKKQYENISSNTVNNKYIQVKYNK